MHTHCSFYPFSQGYVPPFPVLAVGDLRASSEHLELFTCRNTVVMLMVSPNLASFLYVCYHASFFHHWSAAPCDVQTLPMVSFFLCWILFLCPLFHSLAFISLPDHGWAVYRLGVPSASPFPISPVSCVWCLRFPSCCRTNLWFYKWHHRVGVIRTKENKLAVDNLQLGNMLLQLNHIKVKLLAGQ